MIAAVNFNDFNWMTFAAGMLPVVLVGAIAMRRVLVIQRFRKMPGAFVHASSQSSIWLVVVLLVLATCSSAYSALGGEDFLSSMSLLMLIPVILLILTDVVALTDDGIYVIEGFGGYRRYGLDDVLRVEKSGKVILRRGHHIKIERWDSEDGAKMFAELRSLAGRTDAA